MNRTQLIVLQIFFLGLVLAGCSSGKDSGDSGSLPTAPGESSPSQPTSPVLTAPPVAITPVTDLPTTSDASTKPVDNLPVATEPTPVASSPVAIEQSPETAALNPTTETSIEIPIPVSIVLVSVTESIPATMTAETLPVETTVLQPGPLLSELLSTSSEPANETQPVNEVQPASEIQNPNSFEASPISAVSEIPAVLPEILEPNLPVSQPVVDIVSAPIPVALETPSPVSAPAALPTPVAAPSPAPAPVADATPTPASTPATPATPVVSNPAPATPTDNSDEGEQQVEVKGKCSGKKNVKITVTHIQKNQGSDKVVVKCAKDSFIVRLTFKKKDLPFIQILTEAFN